MVLIWLLTACLACYFFAQKYINPNAPSVVSLKSEKSTIQGKPTVSEKDRINIFWYRRAKKFFSQKSLCGLDIRFLHRYNLSLVSNYTAFACLPPIVCYLC